MRCALIAIAGLVCSTGTSRAESINLLANRPTVVNVGSTVANKSIVPAHLVDGKLDTAWNSATGDLVGAWIIVRLPKDVKVDTVKLTVGFTKVDPKLGDLFIKNPRIQKVRVTHGTTVVEKELDIGNRDLQDVPIAGDGGDYKLEVLAVKMGSKKDWRETCISELEVWGTTAKPRPSHPEVFVNAFSAPPPISDVDCAQLGVKTALDSTNATLIDDEMGLCENVEADSNPMDPFSPRTHTLQLVRLSDKSALGASATFTTQLSEGPAEHTNSKLGVEVVKIGPDSQVITALGSTPWNNAADGDATGKLAFTVHLVTKLGLVSVLEVKGTANCVFAEGAPHGNTPDLDLTCGTSVKHFRWADNAYVKR